MNRQARVREVQRPVKPCSPDGRRCSSASDPAKVTSRACCVPQNVTVLEHVIEPLNAAGIPWWIDYGMLLGYCVNGGFYWNDKDCDLGCLVEDRDRVLALGPLLRAQGHGVSYSPDIPGRLYGGGGLLKIAISPKNTNKTDIAFWFRTPEGLLDRVNWFSFDQFKGRAMPWEWIFPTTVGIWEGLEVNLPAEPEKLVAHRYTERWRNLPARRHSSVKR